MVNKMINIFLILRYYRVLMIEFMSRRGYRDYGRYMKVLMYGFLYYIRVKV